MEFSKEEWQKVQSSTNIDLDEINLHEILSLNDYATKQEIKSLYFPLIDLLSEKAQRHMDYISYVHKKLLNKHHKTPFIIGVSGGVAAGKSTIARLLLELLQKQNPTWKVDLITTDGYILPKQQLLEQNIMSKKGFPESYETKTLIQHLKAIKTGEKVATYTYSHLTYDRLVEQFHYIHQPDILIIEGVNIFQVHSQASELVSDYIDYKIYLDVALDVMKKWYIERFLKLQQSAFQKPESHFYQYKDLTETETIAIAEQLWTNVNEPNILHNIYPTKNRADLVLHKTENHKISRLTYNKF